MILERISYVVLLYEIRIECEDGNVNIIFVNINSKIITCMIIRNDSVSNKK